MTEAAKPDRKHLYWGTAKMPVLSQSGIRCSFEFAHAVFAELISTSSRGTPTAQKQSFQVIMLSGG